MFLALGTWKIETNPSQPSGYEVTWIREVEAPPAVSQSELQEAADFITRQVLEKDSILFEG